MIKNVTKNTILAHNCRICRNFLTRGLGLMFKKKVMPTILAFKKPNTASIHTFFVRQGIDVFFLNSRQRITGIVEGLKPWKFCTPKTRAMFVVELPEGAIAKSRTSLGDVINFK